MRRGLGLLRWLGATQDADAKLTEMIAASGLRRSTAYRLVAALVTEGFAERDPVTKRYKLGLEAMQLGLVATHRAPLVERCRLPMRRLARISGDTVFLVVRHGDYALCLHREEGSFPIKALTTDVGKRRLLGIGAGGRAILAELSEQEVDALYARHSTEFQALEVDLAGLRADMHLARQRHHAAAHIHIHIHDTITTGVAGVGCAFKPTPTMLAGISIAAITSRLGPARQRELGQLISAECEQLAF